MTLLHINYFFSGGIPRSPKTGEAFGHLFVTKNTNLKILIDEYLMNVLKDHPVKAVRIDGKTSGDNQEPIETPLTSPNSKPVTSEDIVIEEPMYVYMIEVKEMLIDETSIVAQIVLIISRKRDNELTDIRLAERFRLSERDKSFRKLKDDVYKSYNGKQGIEFFDKPGLMMKREREMMEKSAILDVNHQKYTTLYRMEIEQAPSIEYSDLSAISKFDLNKKQGKLSEFLELHGDIFMIHKANKGWLKSSVC